MIENEVLDSRDVVVLDFEVAWENRENKSLWPSWWSETYFCHRVAKRINSVAQVGAEEKKCKWDEWTTSRAAEQGNLEMVKYCVANACPIDADACANAAEMANSRYSNT